MLRGVLRLMKQLWLHYKPDSEIKAQLQLRPDCEPTSREEVGFVLGWGGTGKVAGVPRLEDRGGSRHHELF